MSTAVDDTIRTVLSEHALLQVPAAELADDTDLYRVGLTSHASVNVMLALEDELGIEFPDQLLRKSTFQSVSALRDAVASLGATV